MNLSGFIGACMGLVGFTVSVIAGMQADNDFSTVMFRALVASFGCYVVGYVVGMMASFVATEHAAKLADEVSKRDAAEKAKREQEMAELAARLQSAADAEAVPAVRA